MRIYELFIKPKPPMSLAQARLHSYKQGVERKQKQFKTELVKQRQQMDNERKQKLLRQRQKQKSIQQRVGRS